jgi:glyoxylase-like metal-dependent hydrolase (beta-lactamase superfamily II)
MSKHSRVKTCRMQIEAAGADRPREDGRLIDRRTVLRTGMAVAAAAPFGRAFAASSPTSGLAASDLPGGLHLISGAGGAVVAARGPEGAVMVDCGRAETAEALHALVLQTTGSRTVSTLFNTCWRLEQSGGNDRLAAAGARILAHENTRLWMGVEIPSRWENKVYPPRAAAARPTETFYSTAPAMALGPETIDWGYLLQAHTDSDIYVFFRKANVLAVGGAVAGTGWPTIDWSTNGWYGGMIRGLETLIKLADDKTVIAPADGVLLTKADLARQHDMHMAIMTRLQTMMEAGMSTAQVLQAQPAAPYVAERGDPTQFLTLAFKSFWGDVRQFRAV